MRVRHLMLEDLRSYSRSEVALGSRITAFVGANGAGKTNVLEAIHLVARGTSPRAADDRDMVRWGAAMARIRCVVERTDGVRTVEVMLFAPTAGERRRPRRWLVDGAGRRADDAIGELRVVAFFPEEMVLLAEAPSARRRYLDAMICQADRGHRRDTREYTRVLEQRNALLKALREAGAAARGGAVPPAELAFWDDALTALAGTIAERRAAAVREMRAAFAEAISTFTEGGTMDLTYAAQCEGGSAMERTAGYRRLLLEKGEREVWQGTSLVGTHREDLVVTAEGRALPTFASRGEQRSAILSLKLAEAEWIRERTGEHPVFLLDDVLSELDARRREALVAALPAESQVLVTAAFPAGLPAGLVAVADVREVTAGAIAEPIAR